MSQKAMMVPIIRKKGLSIGDFRDYWRAVHGPIAARLTGVNFYEQLHLEYPEHFFGTGSPTYAAEGIDGIALLGFDSQTHFDTYRQVASIMLNDEVNVFSFACRYEIAEHLSGAQASSRDPSMPIWPAAMQNRKGYIVLLQRHGDVEDGKAHTRFSDHVRERVATLKSALNLADLFVDFVHPRETATPSNTNIDRFTPRDRQFQAMVRIGSDDHQHVDALINALSELESVKFGRVSRIAASHLFVVDDKITLTALRGAEAANLITRFGASNQTAPDIVKLFAPERR